MSPEVIALGAGIGAGIAVLGAGIGQGITAGSATQGISRQPEASGKIQTAMILGLALIESVFIFSWLVFNGLAGKVPNYAEFVTQPHSSVIQQDVVVADAQDTFVAPDGAVVRLDDN